MHRKNIFFVINDLHLGGVQRKVVDMVNYAAEDKRLSRLNIHILIQYPNPCFLGNFLKNPYCFVHRFPSKLTGKLRFLYFLYLCYFTILLRPSHVLVFLHYPLNYFAFVKLFLFWINFRIIVSLDTIVSSQNSCRYYSHYPNWWIRYIFHFADLVIAQTLYNKYDLIHTFSVSGKKIVIIPNWINSFSKVKLGRTYDIIYCGRFAKEKRLDRIIRIIYDVRKIFQTTRVCLLGSGEELLNLRSLIHLYKLENTIEIHPVTNSIATYMNRSKILILTSEFENFPLVILEAMAAGCIPIVLTFPGVEEIINFGQNGFYESTLSDLTNRIIRIISSPYLSRKISGNSRKHARKFDDRNILKTFETVLSI